MHIKDLLIQYHYDVQHYPLFQYAYDNDNKIDNYKEHLANFLQKQKADIVLWWFLDVNPDVFKYVKDMNKSVYFIMYNSDDPCNINEMTFEKVKIFDLVITPCKEHLNKYRQIAGIRNPMFLVPGYDPSYFYNDEDNDEKYICDISIYCHSLYTDEFFNKQHIARKKLLDDIAIYAKQNCKVFKIFGSKMLNEYYPNHYQGEIEYINKHKLYSLSKINLVTHPFSNKSMSIGDEDILIMASKGLLVTDKIKDGGEIFINNDNCIILNENNYIEQIDLILKNYKLKTELNVINTIKKNAAKTAEKYKWSEWVKRLHLAICEKFFDHNVYAELYDLNNMDKKKINLRWLTTGIENKEICYDFQVPDNFNYKDYATCHKLDYKSVKKIYLHWYINNKNTDFLGNKQNNSLDINETNTCFEQWFMICTALAGVRNYKLRDKSLKNLDTICKNNPRVKINKIIQTYLQLCD